MSLLIAIVAFIFMMVNLLIGDFGKFGAWFVIAVVAFVVWTSSDKEGAQKIDSSKKNSYHKMSDDDKWLEENSWVWSDPNYNGKRNRRK